MIKALAGLAGGVWLAVIVQAIVRAVDARRNR